MKRAASPRRTRSAQTASSGVLAAIVGHELNNISVPLHGFTELALQSTSARDSVRLSLEEIQFAIGRIQALASDLESLAQSGSRPTRVAIADCMVDDMPGHSAARGSVDWRCSATAAVVVDRAHARRAIRALNALAAGGASSKPAAAACSVSRGCIAPARCAACATTTRAKDIFIWVQVYFSRPLSAQSLRNPLDATAAGPSLRRLTLAVLAHSAHCAGGHVFLDVGAGTVSVAFPAGSR